VDAATPLNFFLGSPTDLILRDIENAVIKLSKPGLNLEGENPLATAIREARTFCSQLAMNNR
jgi:hypothetical protein